MIIKNTNNMYSINEFGEVYSFKTRKVLKHNKNSRGYYTVQLYVDKKVSIHRVHRLLAEHFIPNPHNLPQVDHKDEDKSNNIVSNLRWCTNKENSCWFVENNPTIVASGSKGKPIIVDGLIYPSAYKAAQYIQQLNPERNVNTISKELRRFLSGEHKAFTMYGKHTIGS